MVKAADKLANLPAGITKAGYKETTPRKKHDVVTTDNLDESIRHDHKHEARIKSGRTAEKKKNKNLAAE